MNPISRVERTNDGTNYINSLKGFQTNTVIFDPPESGDYEIDINGQKLSIKVTETSSVPSISMFEDPKMYFYACSLVSDVSSWVDKVSDISASSSGSPSYNGELSGFETVDGDYYQFNTSTVSGSSYSCVVLLQLDSLPTAAGILGLGSSVFTIKSTSTLTIDHNNNADPSRYGNLTTGDFMTIGFAIDSSTVEFYVTI